MIMLYIMTAGPAQWGLVQSSSSSKIPYKFVKTIQLKLENEHLFKKLRKITLCQDALKCNEKISQFLYWASKLYNFITTSRECSR